MEDKGPYPNMGPVTKISAAVIQVAIRVNKNGTYCEEKTPGEIFSQPFTQLFGSTPPVFEGFKSLNVNDIIQWLVLLRDRMQEHHHRMRWKTIEEGIQKLREVAVLEVLFGRGGQHDNDPDKVRCTGQILWNLASLGPSQYATFIATIHPDNNRETVGSVANKLRNYESMISGSMQAQVSALAKELREEIKGVREEMRRNSSHVALVRVTGPRVRAQQPPARERGYTPQADLWFFLRDHGEDMGGWDRKPTSALAARVCELIERNTNQGAPTKMKVASASPDQAARYYGIEDMSDPCEGTSIMYGQEGNNDQC
ncbi:hypothetical protein DUI87_31781 [Hirundo rustica rustica]|uniref:Uncharacterized protein n=1 Tax=Hirundo rustica rustica TaxID=333673 RepID=A0A3M0IYN8_HIRRU|nr:hypothetical protein DUI87_31781 [Hirundo rustica rustica]